MVHFRQPAVIQQSGDCGLTLNIWQRVNKKDTKEVLRSFFRGIQAVRSMQVWVLW
jgi:hypothetical protein